MKTRTVGQRSAFTLIEIMIVVAIIALMASIAIPNYMAEKAKRDEKTCRTNLVRIQSAILKWAETGKKKDGAVVTGANILPFFEGSTLVCPAGGRNFSESYRLTEVGKVPECISKGGGAKKGHIIAVFVTDIVPK